MRLRASANVADPIGASAEHEHRLVGCNGQTVRPSEAVNVGNLKPVGTKAIRERKAGVLNGNDFKPTIDVVCRIRQRNAANSRSVVRPHKEKPVIVSSCQIIGTGHHVDELRGLAAKQLVLNVRGDTSNARLLGWSGLTALVSLAGGCTGQERKARRNKQEFLHVKKQ